jgi:hypothetical protein
VYYQIDHQKQPINTDSVYSRIDHQTRPGSSTTAGGGERKDGGGGGGGEGSEEEEGYRDGEGGVGGVGVVRGGGGKGGRWSHTTVFVEEDVTVREVLEVIGLKLQCSDEVRLHMLYRLYYIYYSIYSSSTTVIIKSILRWLHI